MVMVVVVVVVVVWWWLSFVIVVAGGGLASTQSSRTPPDCHARHKSRTHQCNSASRSRGRTGCTPVTKSRGEQYAGQSGCKASMIVVCILYVRGPVLVPAASNSLFHADHSPLRSSQMPVDTALERAEGLSNAVSTSAWKPHNGEWLSFKSELESAGPSTGPLMTVAFYFSVTVPYNQQTCRPANQKKERTNQSANTPVSQLASQPAGQQVSWPAQPAHLIRMV